MHGKPNGSHPPLFCSTRSCRSFHQPCFGRMITQVCWECLSLISGMEMEFPTCPTKQLQPVLNGWDRARRWCQILCMQGKCAMCLAFRCGRNCSWVSDVSGNGAHVLHQPASRDLPELVLHEHNMPVQTTKVFFFFSLFFSSFFSPLLAMLWHWLASQISLG